MSNLKIVNETINLMGRKKLESVASDDWGEVINEAVDNAKDYLLSLYDWGFASRFSTLAQLPEPSDLRFRHAYKVPSDSVKETNVYHYQIVENEKRIDQPLFPSQWSKFNDAISTNVEKNLVLRYVSNITNISSAPATFVRMYAYYVASIVTPPLLKDKQLTIDYSQMYRLHFNEAIELDQLSHNSYQGWINSENY